MTNNCDVSVIFVNYKTKDLTISAINSVIEKTQNINFEIFVVDNNSQDGSIEEIEKQFPDINVIKNKSNIGFGAANNLAIKQAKGKYILCLNTDTVLMNNALRIMFDYMEENPNTGVCGGNLYNENLKPSMSYANFPNFWNCLAFSWLIKRIFPILRNHTETKKIKEVDFITGADIFLRKSVLDAIGYFDENFFMFAEEADLCKRIKNTGYKRVIVPEAKIIHLEGKSSANFWGNIKLRVKSRYLYAQKHQTIIDILGMKLSYILLHSLALIFTFNKENIELIKLHFKG